MATWLLFCKKTGMLFKGKNAILKVKKQKGKKVKISRAIYIPAIFTFLPFTFKSPSWSKIALFTFLLFYSFTFK